MSPIALKKKTKESASDEDFGDAAEYEDLFGGIGEASKDPAQGTAATSTSPSPSQKLTPEARIARFNDLHKFLSERVGLQPTQKVPQVRKTAWTHLFGLATTEGQLEQVVELFPKWRDSRRIFTPQIAEAFVRRCEELQCPQLALQVFSDHPKYGLDLSSTTAARHLLHSLHLKHPLSSSITLVALYKLYNLPLVSKDLVSCSLLTSACYKNNTSESLVVAKSLVPELKKLLEKKDPEKWSIPVSGAKERTTTKGKEKAWLAWTLAKVEKALIKQGEGVEWLESWRKRAGHVQATA